MPNFTNLPPELRMSVYDFHFQDAVEKVRIQDGRYPTILCINHQITGEAVHIGRRVTISAMKVKEEELHKQEAARDAIEAEERMSLFIASDEIDSKMMTIWRRVWDLQMELQGLKDMLRMYERVQRRNA